MAIKPFLRVYPGDDDDNYYLPHVDPAATRDGLSKAIPSAQIPLQSGETVYEDGITLGSQRISLSGRIYRAEYTDADAMHTAIEAFKTGIGATATGSSARMTFGRYDTSDDSSVYNDYAYVTGFTINGEPGLEYTGTNDCEWSLDIEIKRPDLWTDSSATPDPGADADEVVITASGRIVLVITDALIIKDASDNIRGTLTAGDGTLKITGDYKFL